ncbi:MAG: hypothetical protein JWO78_2111 [Micavibrio sp.]|nr:hypothetical protein [Micavibrio sp.]
MNFKTITASLVLAGVAGIAAAQPATDAAPAAGTFSTYTRANSGQYAARPHLAYVRTGNQAVDNTARAGLMALHEKLRDLTTIDIAGVVEIDIERDDIALFPMIYWPVGENAPTLSAAAQKKVQAYIQMSPAHLIVFDLNNMGKGLGNMGPLRHMLGDVTLRPLTKVREDSAVNKTFFKAKDLRGTFNYNDNILIEEPAPQGSGLEVVTSVIIGENNWSAAWAAKRSEARDVALRAGVNFVMLAMTGNYKLDQADIMEKDSQKNDKKNDKPQSGLPQLDKK